MIGILFILFLALISGLLVSIAPETTVKHIETEPVLSVLPQTQCGKCNYPGCQPYAEAIVRGEAISTSARLVVPQPLKHWLTYWADKSSH